MGYLLFQAFGIQAYAVFMARTKFSRENFPVLYKVPQPRAVQSVALGEGTGIEYFGIRIRVPWQGMTEEKERDATWFAKFQNGKAVMMTDPTIWWNLLI